MGIKHNVSHVSSYSHTTGLSQIWRLLIIFDSLFVREAILAVTSSTERKQQYEDLCSQRG